MGRSLARGGAGKRRSWGGAVPARGGGWEGDGGTGWGTWEWEWGGRTRHQASEGAGQKE